MHFTICLYPLFCFRITWYYLTEAFPEKSPKLAFMNFFYDLLVSLHRTSCLAQLDMFCIGFSGTMSGGAGFLKVSWYPNMSAFKARGHLLRNASLSLSEEKIFT